MNFINRAIKNVTRKLSKTILLILTFFVIGNFVIIGLSVANASESAKTLTRQKMRAVVKYELDYNAIWKYTETIEDEDELQQFYQNYPRIKLSEVNDILKDPRVKTANANSTEMVYQIEGGLDFVHLNNSAEENSSNGTSCWIDENGNQVCETYQEPTFSVKANYFPSMIEIEDGDFAITSGRFYNQDEINNSAKVVVISDALAAVNGVSIGDTVSIAVAQLGYYLKDSGITEEDLRLDLEVIGTYSHNHPIMPDSDRYDYTWPYENYDNMLLMPGTTLTSARMTYEQKQWDYYATIYPEEEYYSNPENRPSNDLNKIDLYEVTLLLADPLDVDKFVEDYGKDLAQFKKLNADNEEFKKLSKPLDTLSDYATFIVWLVVINAIVIITLVTALTLKTREYEIGVLLSIGASKLKVIAQFFVELAIVAILGFTLAIGSGSIISSKIGAMLLDNQIQSSDLVEEDDWGYDYESIWDNDYTTDITLEDLVAEYNVTVSPVIIGEIYVMGLGIVLISVIIPSIMIMRYNPKKILMGMN